jgi:hypothetical protein
MTAMSAEFLLGTIRLAVAFALLSGNCAWAQSAQRPVQAVDTRVTDRYGANPNVVGTMQTNQDAMVPDIRAEAGTLRGISLNVSAGLGYDDNVFRTESNTSNDFFWTVRPSLYLDGGLGRHGFGLGYEGEFQRYSEFSSQDFDDHRVFADAVLDLTRKLNLNLEAGVRFGHDPRGGIGTCIICSPTPDAWRAHRVGAELVIGRQISRAQIIPGVEYSGVRYTNNGQSDRDLDRQDYRLRGRYRLTPRLSSIAEGRFAAIDYLQPNNGLDRTEAGLLVGIGWEATAKTSGEILVGTLVQDFDDPAQSSGRNFNWDARVHWAPKPYSKITLFTSRRSRDDASGGIGAYLADSFGIGWAHAFSERLLGNTDVEYTLARFSTGRKDNYLAFHIGLTRSLTSWLSIGAEYQYLNRRSNIPGIDYDDNIIWLNLTAGLHHSLSF